MQLLDVLGVQGGQVEHGELALAQRRPVLGVAVLHRVAAVGRRDGAGGRGILLVGRVDDPLEAGLLRGEVF